jgi:predicted acyltransferase
LRREEPGLSGERKAAWLAGAGIAALAAGALWGLVFPINKNLWTSSFVLYAGGWSLLLLALFYLVIDVWQYTRWTFFFVVIGMNSILIYMAARFISFRYTTDFLFEGLLAPLDDPLRLLLWWTGFVAVKWAFLYFLYRQKVFLRV